MAVDTAFVVWPESDFILSFKEIPVEGFALLLIMPIGMIVGAAEEVDGMRCSFKFSAGFAGASTRRVVGLEVDTSGLASAGVPDCSALMRSLKDTRNPTFGGCRAPVACAGTAHVAVDGLVVPDCCC